MKGIEYLFIACVAMFIAIAIMGLTGCGEPNRQAKEPTTEQRATTEYEKKKAEIIARKHQRYQNYRKARNAVYQDYRSSLKSLNRTAYLTYLEHGKRYSPLFKQARHKVKMYFLYRVHRVADKYGYNYTGIN